ncbi:MAG TPA: tRNA-dihydrouridine synthase family protein, partial [Spirochaetales bacterium]|nr:tRNA-dihydrouridine synthase family protein [Spirochaetales bacterium]
FGGCDRYYTEMCSAPAYLGNAPWDEWFMDTRPAPERTSIQFYSPDTERMSLAIEKLTLDSLPHGGVDLNFGCSAPLITRLGAGVSWMKDSAGAAAMVQAARKALPKEFMLSAKLRLGHDDSEDRLLEFCQGLCDAGADYLVLHPRLANQKFRRLGKWSSVATMARALPVPLIGNGDVRSYDDYARAVGEYGASGVMIGREAVRRPWIFALIRGLEANPDFSMSINIEETAFTMLDSIETQLPSIFYLSRARRFFFYFCDNLAFAHHIKCAIQNAPSLDAIRALLRSYFDEVPTDRIKLQEK